MKVKPKGVNILQSINEKSNRRKKRLIAQNKGRFQKKK
jgi:hypothetical protein